MPGSIRFPKMRAPAKANPSGKNGDIVTKECSVNILKDTMPLIKYITDIANVYIMN
jgi:hypothetical protein